MDLMEFFNETAGSLVASLHCMTHNENTCAPKCDEEYLCQSVNMKQMIQETCTAM